MTKRLDTMSPGDKGVISALHAFSAHEPLRRRLDAVGFRVGRRIELLRTAMAQGPLHVRVGTTEIMLRRGEASSVEVLLG